MRKIKGTRAAFTAVMAVAIIATMCVLLPATASAEPGGIVISELNYHAGSDLDVDDWLELTNTSASTIDVSGWALTAGVTGTLPPGSVIPSGGYFVVAKDAPAFLAAHGFAADAAYGGNLSNGGETVSLSNGATVIDSVSYLDTDPWPPAPDGNGPSLELRGLLFDNTLPENWGPSTVAGGTPRAKNSLDGTAPPPRITQVVATPRQPDPAQAVTVTARLPIGSTATLDYKVMFDAEVSVAFLDDAASPGGSGDGNYSGTIPGQAAGQLVRYRISAGINGVPFTFPAAGDSINYEGIVVRNPAVATNLPVFEWFMEDAVLDDILANHRYDDVTGPAVIAYNGTVIDNARMRVRGQSSRSLPKVSWKVELPSGRTLSLPAFPYPMDEFALQRDVDPLADIAWATVRDAGARSLGIGPMRTQRNGEFYSVVRAMETMDGTWRDDQKVDDWAIYKGNAGGLETASSAAALAARTAPGCPLCLPEPVLEKKAREDEDYTDVWNLTRAVDAPVSAAQKEWMFANLNVPELVNYMALNVLMRHQDSNWKNWWITRDTEGTGRYEMWHWDLNWTFTTPAEDGKGLFLTPESSNQLLQALVADPDIKEMYFRRLRTLADVYLTPGRYEAQWDAITQPYLADWALETAKWGGRDATLARTKFLQGLTDRRQLVADNSGPGKPIPPSQSPAPSVSINEIQYAPAQGQAAEFIELANPSTSESVDLSGWTIEQLGLTIQPGTILLPGARVVFVKDDPVFRSTYGPGNRYVGGVYSGSLDNTGMTLTLRQGTRVVDDVAYSSAAPWPTAAAGSGPSLELLDPSIDNTVPANWSATSSVGGTPSSPNTVQLGPDLTPPSAPTDLVATDVTSSSVSLSWTAATDDRAVAGYRVLRNGVEMAASVTGTTFTDATVAASTTYSYVVQAIDAGGNVGPASASLPVTTAGLDPVLYADGFTGADGSPWGSAWSPSTANGSLTLQADAGQMSYDNVSGAFVRAQLSGVPNRTNGEVVFSYRWSATNPTGYFNVYLRGSGGWLNGYRPRNGYGLELSSNSSTVSLRKVRDGVSTTLASTSGAQQVSTAKQWVRLQVNGSKIQYRTWVDGQPEPTTWRGVATDTTVSAPGQLFVSSVRPSSGSSRQVTLDDLTLLDDPSLLTPDTTPPSAPGTPVASNVTTSGVTLNWPAATDAGGIAGYRVIRNGVELPATVTGTTFTDEGLNASTTYTYAVKAVDQAGLVGPASGAIQVTTAASTPVLFQDTFTGTDGSSWGTSWTTTVGNGSVTRQANEGRLAFNDVASANARAVLSGVAARADADLRFSYRWSATSQTGYFSVFLRGSGGWANAYRPLNGYGLEFAANSTTVTAKRTVNGTVSTLSSTSGAQQVSTAKQWVRLRVVGSTIQYKTWADGQAEPTTWRVTLTDGAVTAPGQAYLSLVRSSSNAGGAKYVSIDDVTLGNGS
jgi:chitodextrinase